MVELRIQIFDPPTGGAPRPFSLVINTKDYTASMFVFQEKKHLLMKHTAVVGAPYMDFNAVNGEIVQFPMGDTFQTHTIIIHHDVVCENEFFLSNIALDTGVQPIFVIQPQATVRIDDTVEPECRK